MAELKQLTSYVREFLMIQSADHITGLTAASPTLNLSMAGAAFQSTNAVIAEVGNGYYKASLTSTDTRTLGDLAFHFTATSADPTDFIDQVRANILGDTLPASIAGTVTTGTNLDKTGYSLAGTVTAGTILDKTGYSLAGTVTAGTVIDKSGYGLTASERTSVASAAWTTAQSESYATLHVNPTPIQLLYETRSMLAEKTVSVTSVTILQIDGATTAETFTLDSTSPTQIHRSA